MAQAFLGHGQMKPEQQEIERLRGEVAKLKLERDTLKAVQGRCTPARGRNSIMLSLVAGTVSGPQLIGGAIPVKNLVLWCMRA